MSTGFLMARRVRTKMWATLETEGSSLWSHNVFTYSRSRKTFTPCSRSPQSGSGSWSIRRRGCDLASENILLILEYSKHENEKILVNKD